MKNEIKILHYHEYLKLRDEELEEKVPITFSVTQEHINEGEAKHCKHCPIALAVRKTISPFVDSSVGGYDIIINYRRVFVEGIAYLNSHSIKLPDIAFKFIQHFDNQLPVEPFSFEVQIPKCFLKVKPTIVL